MLYLVERAKKCLDFSVTLYVIHLLICIMYGGWPSSITWWIVNCTGIAVMALFGEYLCIRRELQEIPITRYRSSKQIPFSLLFSYVCLRVNTWEISFYASNTQTICCLKFYSMFHFSLIIICWVSVTECAALFLYLSPLVLHIRSFVISITSILLSSLRYFLEIHWF